MKRRILFGLAAAMLLFGGRVYAHHSFAATYFVDQVITVKGTVTEFLFRNPHSFLKVQAPDEKGTCRSGPSSGPAARNWPGQCGERHSEAGRSGGGVGQSRTNGVGTQDPPQEHQPVRGWI